MASHLNISGPDAYAHVIQQSVGRVMSLVDSEPSSPSYGSFDRTWWCWKFTDFSASRFQEGAYFLSWLAQSDLTDATDRLRDRARSLAEAALLFWARLQHRDGSFDEAYPFERSLAATAFTGFYNGLAYGALFKDLPSATKQRVEDCLWMAGQWLSRNGEHHGVLSNHLAAAAAACQVIGDQLKTDAFTPARDRFLEVIYSSQHEDEGWLREYGGADPGYQSHGLFYLAEIWKRTVCAELFECLRRASDFSAWFVHPDGSMGGEYASRGTRFAFPAGFEILSGQIGSSAAIASHLRSAIGDGRCIGPLQMDAWNLFPMLNNYVFALDNSSDILPRQSLPWAKDGVRKVFRGCGLMVGNHAGRKVVAGLNTGGSLKMWSLDSHELLYEDCGYLHEEETETAVSQNEAQEGTLLDAESLTMQLSVQFRPVSKQRFNAYKFVGFRLFTTTFGRLALASRWLKTLLVRVLIHSRKDTGVRLSRKISFDKDGALKVEDRITGADGLLQAVARQVPFHMGSSRYESDTGGAFALRGCEDPLVNNDYAERVLIIECDDDLKFVEEPEPERKMA